MISLKSQSELDLISRAGRIVSLTIEALRQKIRPGVSTYELDIIAEGIFKQYGANSAFKNYRGFPGNICTSINEELIHGIPSKERILREADIISLDIGVNLKGFFADAAVTFPVGKIDKEAERLLKITEEALYLGIEKARSNAHLSDISYAIQSHVERNGFSVVREFVGHGIGAQMHEEPQIPNFGEPGYGPLLKKGMVLAIEPMVNSRDSGVEILSDGWTVVSGDRNLTAHFEHTICVTDGEPQILTA